MKTHWSYGDGALVQVCRNAHDARRGARRPNITRDVLAVTCSKCIKAIGPDAIAKAKAAAETPAAPAPVAEDATFVETTFSFKLAIDCLVQMIAAGMIRGPHGYGYWCEEVDAKSGADVWTDEQIARHVIGGGVARFKCYEDDGRRWTEDLTREKFFAGVGMFLAEGGFSSTRDEETGIVDVEVDAPTSDRIMQFALFGKQVYG